jgi:hypothetical protein
MRILREQEDPITYEMRDIIKKILQVLKEDQNLGFGPRLQTATESKKKIKEIIVSKQRLLIKSRETLQELESKLKLTKRSNDNLREELLESLGSEL